MLCTPSRIDYDEKYDILYLCSNNSNNAYGDELDDTIMLMRDLDTDDIKGATIFGFKKKFVNDKKCSELLSKYLDISGLRLQV